jgi:hypothetical protein
VLVHGDLGAISQAGSAIESRSIEKKPLRRLQHLLTIPGFFHVLMAITDAIHRILVLKSEARNGVDPTFMDCIRVLRKKESRKMESKPGYRAMHETILHTGIVSRLVCWALELEEKPTSNIKSAERTTYNSLESYAKSQPTWSDIQILARKVALENVAQLEHVMDKRAFSEQGQLQDEVRDNHQMMLARVLSAPLDLYMEGTYPSPGRQYDIIGW